jgi:hypothetical protein
MVASALAVLSVMTILCGLLIAIACWSKSRRAPVRHDDERLDHLPASDED